TTGLQPVPRPLSAWRGGAGLCGSGRARRAFLMGGALQGPELLACGVYPYLRRCTRQQGTFYGDCFSPCCLFSLYSWCSHLDNLKAVLTPTRSTCRMRPIQDCPVAARHTLVPLLTTPHGRCRP